MSTMYISLSFPNGALVGSHSCRCVALKRATHVTNYGSDIWVFVATRCYKRVKGEPQQPLC